MNPFIREKCDVISDHKSQSLKETCDLKRK